MQFAHEKLSVYQKALAFLGRIQQSIASWSKQHAFVDHLSRAAESNGRYAELSRQDFLDTANAAAAKLAVSLDMGVRRGIWSASEAGTGKSLLVRVGQMTARKDYID